MFLPLSLFSYIDFRFCEHCISPIKMYYSTSSRSVMASCVDCDGGGIHSCGSIRHCGHLCRTLIIFWIAHWMFAGFQWIGWGAIRCWYHRRSICMIMMTRTTIFQRMCKLRVGWNWLTLFMVLDGFIEKDKLKRFDSRPVHTAWFKSSTHWMFACYGIEARTTQTDGCKQTFVRQSCPILGTVSAENMSTWSVMQLKRM